MKTCPRCQQTLPLDAFSPANRVKGPGNGWCRACFKAYNADRWKNRDREAKREQRQAWLQANRQKMSEYYAEYHRTNPDVKRRAHLKGYGLTIDQYEAMVVEQGGVCAICLLPPPGNGTNGKRLHVDHDHETGQVRGLLCTRCNTALGHLADDHERIQRMIDYLKRAT